MSKPRSRAPMRRRRPRRDRRGRCCANSAWPSRRPTFTPRSKSSRRNWVGTGARLRRAPEPASTSSCSAPTDEDRAMNTMNKYTTGLARIGLTPKVPEPISPAQMKHAEERATNEQNKIADNITRFSGSMTFVYIHIIWFASWIAFGVEKYPFGLLTMIVSLEAIFLSTFVMISQNRADAKRQVISNEQWTTVKEEDQQNRQLLDISNQILKLTRDVHAYAHAAGQGNGIPAPAQASAGPGAPATEAGGPSGAPAERAGGGGAGTW